jgi:N-acetylglutamate synthase-like GNAT family acetyltransferase
MNDLEPLVRFFQTLDDLGERSERTWWGAVVTDARFPLIHDANYASIDSPDERLALADVEAVLLPAVEAAGAVDEHIVTMDPHRTGPLLHEVQQRGGRVRLDTVMEHRGRPLEGPRHAVVEVSRPDDGHWDDVRRSFREFDLTEPGVLDQMIRRERDLLTPFGKRWFTASLEGATAGFGALFLQAEVAYVDNVVTFPHARRRGVATSIVSRMVGLAREEGATHIYLLAHEPEPIRMYRRLGFQDVGQIGDMVRSLAGGGPGQQV